jgi:multidrug efflux pump
MTSLAFILGVVPLMVAHGAGAEMRRTLGTAVFSGMLGVTIVGLFLTPVFFSVIDWLSRSAAFTSPPARLVGGALLDVTTLGLRRIVRPVLRRCRRTPAPSANGKAPVSPTAISNGEATSSAVCEGTG